MPRSFHTLPQDLFTRLLRSRDFLAANAAASVSLSDAAKVACFSPFHYIRLFEEAFGETPHRFLARQRMEQAQRLLRGGSLTVTEVCLESGYQSLGSFSTAFHKRFGCSPAEYRRIFHFPKAARLFCVPSCFPALWD